MSHVKGGGGGRQSVSLCDKGVGGGGILNFATSYFKNIIKAILHVSTKLEQFHWKALDKLNNLTNIHVMTFNVHLAQFDVAPTRTSAGISLICDYLINCKICDTR